MTAPRRASGRSVAACCCVVASALCWHGRRGAGARLAVRGAAAAAAGARRQVSALRDPDAAERPAGRRRAAPRAAGRQHAAARARRQRARIRRASSGSRTWRRRCSIRARRRSRRSEMNDAIDFIGGAMGAGAGTDLTLRQHGRDEGQLRDRAADAVRHGAASGVRAGGDRAPAAADAVGPAGQPRGSRSTSPTPCSIGSSTASIRTACPTAARPRRSPASRATICVAFHQQLLRAEQRHPRRSSAT